jgi:hypothetical protein
LFIFFFNNHNEFSFFFIHQIEHCKLLNENLSHLFNESTINKTKDAQHQPQQQQQQSTIKTNKFSIVNLIGESSTTSSTCTSTSCSSSSISSNSFINNNENNKKRKHVSSSSSSSTPTSKHQLNNKSASMSKKRLKLDEDAANLKQEQHHLFNNLNVIQNGKSFEKYKLCSLIKLVY